MTTLSPNSRPGLIAMREYIRKDKPKQLRKDFAFPEPLSHGWILPYLLQLEAMAWGRWNYWSETTTAGQLLDSPIPQIEWSEDHGESSPGRRTLEKSLDCITRSGDWRGWSGWTYFDYFLEWLLFGFGHPSQRTEPAARSEMEGASERLYQIFNLEPLLAYPHDYLGDILAENNFGRRSRFYPTPMCIASMMVDMQMKTGEDMRAKSTCDPALGTGRMLLAASNYSMNLYGQDISATVIKACLVNGYLYAPWLVRPFSFMTRNGLQQPAQPHLRLTTTERRQAPTDTAPQMELF